MTTEMATIVTLIGGIVVAGTTYLFTKWREREAEWRKDKRECYKAFMAGCNGNIESDATSEGRLAFNRATNDLSLIAPERVIKALTAYREEISISNPNRRQDRHNELFSQLLYEMRRDLEIRPRDKKRTFKVFLWSPGNTQQESADKQK